jgi:hypothetical protein
MPYKINSIEAFTGGSGQMAVISELLHRKCNAAIPLIDIGTDVFAFQDDRAEVARIQVKTASGKPYKKANGYCAEFRIPIIQLERTDGPSLFYALAVRLTDGWGSIIVISREKLKTLREDGMGSEIKNNKKFDLRLYIQLRHQQDADEQTLKAQCGEIDLTEYLNAWESLPPLKPPAPIN